MARKVFIAADVDPAFVSRVSADERFDVVRKRAHKADEMIAAIGDAEVLVTRYHNEVTGSVIASAPRLELILQGTSGLDNIDHETAARRNVKIVGIPGENANAVAELVLGFIIALTRTIPTYDRMLRRKEWNRDDCATRLELRSHRVGIIGLGRVGGRVARLAGSVGMSVSAYDPYINETTALERGALLVGSLEQLLRSSEIVSFHVPLTDETRQMLHAKNLGQLPPGAYVINSSRGAVIDIDAALAALREGHLSGIALDVYDEEPPNRTWPDDPRLILTPHIAGCSRESKASIGRMLYEKLCEHYRVDPMVG